MSSALNSGRLLTLKKTDSEFQKYIWGDFSKTERALPLQSLNVNTEQEQVTFEIVPRNLKPRRGLFLQTFKFRNLYLSLTPVLLILIKNLVDDTLTDEILAGLSCLAVVFVQLGIELANDVQDHIRGLDRIHPGAGNLALKSAWLSARDLKKLAYFLLGIGGILALPSLWYFPEIFYTILPLAGFGMLGAYSAKMGLKYRGWSEWIVFFMFGPLLTVGYQLSFGGGFDLEVCFIGLLTGWLAVFHIHLKNFDHIMVNTQAQFRSSIVRLGFDRGKRLLIIWWILFVVGFSLYQALYSTQDWLLVVAGFLVVLSLPVISSFNKLQAAVGSKIHQAVVLGNKASQFAIALWIFQSLWNFFLAEGFF